MALFVVGLSHTNAPVALREELTIALHHQAFAVAKRVRAETEIARHATSMT